MLEAEIIDRLRRYTRLRMSLGDLELWLEDVSWDARPGYARQLAFDALRLIAEHTNGDFPQADLRRRIGRLVAPRVVDTPGVVVCTKVGPIVGVDPAVGITVRPAESPVQIGRSREESPTAQLVGIGIPERSPDVVR